jgi:hypothetical protein
MNKNKISEFLMKSPFGWLWIIGLGCIGLSALYLLGAVKMTGPREYSYGILIFGVVLTALCAISFLSHIKRLK